MSAGAWLDVQSDSGHTGNVADGANYTAFGLKPPCSPLTLLASFNVNSLAPKWRELPHLSDCSCFLVKYRCFLEAAQMMGRCSSGICGALALLALLLPLRQRGCWGLTPGSGDLEKSPASDPDPWEVLHRNKRSWVWNQFFVLEEFTGNEPLYVGKEHFSTTL
ncbi:unnamed protein product [Pleuronectes platessa]|uniref:Uncharacterized protein n=1 Tax=Pleuronectes platessa TaxID=8262 RepID=A0A9N7Z6S7_PLEPL|nr:unnamed protein product [Pleuronectes platessa]